MFGSDNQLLFIAFVVVLVILLLFDRQYSNESMAILCPQKCHMDEQQGRCINDETNLPCARPAN